MAINQGPAHPSRANRKAWRSVLVCGAVRIALVPRLGSDTGTAWLGAPKTSQDQESWVFARLSLLLHDVRMAELAVHQK